MSAPADRSDAERSDAERIEAIHRLAKRVGLSEGWAVAIAGAGLTVADVYRGTGNGCCGCGLPSTKGTP